MNDQAARDWVFIGMERSEQIDGYLVLVALYRAPNRGIRYVVDASQQGEQRDLRCVGDRDFETRIEAAAAGHLHMLKVIRAGQGSERS